MSDPRFWIATVLSAAVHALGVGWILFIGFLLSLWPVETPPVLLQAYGNSDVEGMNVSVVTLDPGSMTVGVENTPGGTGDEEEPLRPSTPAVVVRPLESEEQPPEPETTPEPPKLPSPQPAVAMVERPKEESNPAPDTAKKPDTKETGVKASGAAGGSQLKAGTPSAGGKLGALTGVREITEFEPTYPRQALLYGQQGIVMLRLKISADGAVLDRSVEKSSGYPLLDEAALNDCCRCRFRPATRDGKPVECECCKPFRYEIANR